jgi:RNA polymerase sigma factor (sigma-70 family)
MADQPTPHRDPDRNAHLVDYLARERYGWLCAIAQRWGASPQSVDDIVQSAMVDVLRSFPGPDERNLVAAYAARCVRNQVFKANRRHGRKESRNRPMPARAASDVGGTETEFGIAEASQPDPLELVIETESAEEARALLAELPEDQLTVLVLVAAGYGHAEIAERTGLSLRGVRKRVWKANQRLERRG